jgi:hypothetical protein
MELCTYCGTPRTGLSCCGEVRFESEDDVYSDKELLEWAAKAAGIELEWGDTNSPGYYSQWRGLPQWNNWNPLTDDDDALRLAVNCHIDIRHFMYRDNRMDCLVDRIGRVFAENVDQEDPCAATRRAIVRAAAAIGKDMP